MFNNSMPTFVDSSFTNSPIQSDNLPTLMDLSFESLSPRYRKVRAWLNFSITLIILIIGMVLYYQNFYVIAQHKREIILLVTIFLVSLSFLYSFYHLLADQHKFFALREQDISYASGLIFKSIVTQPMLRIQHVELKQGPIERKVNLAKLQVFSAGGALHTFEIPGLSLNKAQAIRQFILDHKDVNKHG